jgi:outer membrane protein
MKRKEESFMIGQTVRYCVRKIYASSVDFASYSTLCRNCNKVFFRPSRLSMLVVAAASLTIAAPPILTPGKAVDDALKNNYGIMVARNDADIAKINNTLGNAGMLPSVAASSSDNVIAGGASAQKTSDGVTTEKSPVTTNTLSAGVLLGWTLFDGGKMFAAKSKLNDFEELGKIQYLDNVLRTVYSVTFAYYDIVRQKQRLASINKVLLLNQERVTIAQTSFGQGLSPKTVLLQAQIDLNVNRENALNQQNAIASAKRALNQLLSRDPMSDFEVVDTIGGAFAPDTQGIIDKVHDRNTGIKTSQMLLHIARLNVKEASAAFWPKIGVSAGYVYSQNDNSDAAVTMSRMSGPQLGASITVPLYQSGNAARQVKTAKLQAQSAEYDLREMTLQTETAVRNALADFENQQALLEMERSNTVLAKENLEISMQRLRYGQSTSLEVRQAEDSYVQSLTRLTDIEFNLKIAEMKLKQLLVNL